VWWTDKTDGAQHHSVRTMLYISDIYRELTRQIDAKLWTQWKLFPMIEGINNTHTCTLYWSTFECIIYTQSLCRFTICVRWIIHGHQVDVHVCIMYKQTSQNALNNIHVILYKECTSVWAVPEKYPQVVVYGRICLTPPSIPDNHTAF
jgi:hypothetical protein